MLTLLVLLLAPPTPRSEVARLEAWFAQATAIVEAQPTQLSPDKARRRAALLETLDGYVSGGLFPSHDVGEWTPVFVDDDGTRCAVAHLLEMTGDADLMWQVAATQNRAEVIDLIDDPDFEAWLNWHGLTLAEAAAIQPTYPPPPVWSCICGGATYWDDALYVSGEKDWRTMALVEPSGNGVRVVEDLNPNPDDESWEGRTIDQEVESLLGGPHGDPPWLVAMMQSGHMYQIPLAPLCPAKAPYPGPPEPLTQAQIVRAVLARGDCPKVLTKIDPRWGYSPDCSCDVAGRGAPPWALFVVMGLWATCRKRPTPR